MNIYLDIDGVLLANDKNVTLYSREFLSYVLEHFPNSTYWLTTHCQGDASVPIKHVGHLFDPNTVELMKKIKATKWDVSKTEAIDFSQPFLWFDDDCFDFERNELRKHGVYENWIQIDLARDEHQLQKLVQSFPLPVNNIERTVSVRERWRTVSWRTVERCQVPLISLISATHQWRTVSGTIN